MVYDCFTFYNELDLLEIRLNVLSEVVDKFVLVEADRTQTNKEKPFYFEGNKERYKLFLDKIIHIKVTEYPEIKDEWTLENYQRNQISLGLANCIPEDIVLVSDIDEIPNPEIIIHYREKGKDICKLKQVFFYYYLNYRRCIHKYWYLAKIARYKEIASNNYTPQKIRMEKNTKTIKNAGWHFSYLGGKEAIKNKLESIVEGVYNKVNYNIDAIENKIRMGLDLFGRKDRRLIPVKITKGKYPRYIVDNQEKYRHLIYQEINQYIVVKNTVYCWGILLLGLPKNIVIRIAKIILPKSIIIKLKSIKNG